MTRYTEGFSHFVTSMTAPAASGWSDSCRVGLAPTEERRLTTAHTHYRHLMVGGLLRLQSGRPAKLVYSGSYISCDGRVLRWPSPRRRKGGENRQAAAIG